MKSWIVSVAALLLILSDAGAQFIISSYTIDGGGGISTGAGFSLSGTIGQPDASAPAAGGGFFLTGGFWGGVNPGLSGFTLWAENNLPPGSDMSFDGDGNGDGIPNGVAYVFGNTPISPVGGQSSGTGRIPAPPSIPPDVDVYLEASAAALGGSPLQVWGVFISWEDGNPPSIVSPDFDSIVGNEVVSTGLGATYFFRYRVVQR